MDGRPILRGGFARATRAGAGCLLISRACLETLAKDLPLVEAGESSIPFRSFSEHPIERQEDGSLSWLPEDFAFCGRWRRTGGEVWLDTEAKILHIGAKAYGGTSMAESMGLPA